MRCLATVGRTGHINADHLLALDTLTARIRELELPGTAGELETLILTSEYQDWYSLLHH
jgi:hypothetical protein